MMKTTIKNIRKSLSVLCFVMLIPMAAAAIPPDECSNEAIPPSTPSSAFTELEDGSVVRHEPTGLEWQRCEFGTFWRWIESQERMGCVPPWGSSNSHRFSWPEAVHLGADPVGGWRLPNVNELRSIVEHCRSDPAINQSVFPDVSSIRTYWSGSPYVDDPEQAWRVGMGQGRGRDAYKFASSIRVRLVRDAGSGEPSNAGDKQWSHEHHTNSARTIFAANGMVYSGSSDNTVVAADAQDGSLDWAHGHHGRSVVSVFVRDNVIYSGALEAKVVAADAGNGALLWYHEHHAAASLFERDGVLYSGSGDWSVYAMNTSDGSILWSHEHHEHGVTSVFEFDGVVYSGGGFWDRAIVAADASDGSLLWQHGHHSGTVNSVFVSDGVVYSSSDDNTVVAADADDGSLLWRHAHHGRSVRSVMVREDIVYSGAGDGTLIAADAENGNFLWIHDNHEDSMRAVYQKDGVVYSASVDGMVIASEAPSLEELGDN